MMPSLTRQWIGWALTMGLTGSVTAQRDLAEISRFGAAGGAVRLLDLAADGDLLATQGAELRRRTGPGGEPAPDRSIVVRSLHQGTVIARRAPDASRGLVGLELLPDGKRALIVSPNAPTVLWGFRTGVERTCGELPSGLMMSVAVEDRTVIAVLSSGRERRLSLWSLAAEGRLEQLADHPFDSLRHARLVRVADQNAIAVCSHEARHWVVDLEDPTRTPQEVPRPACDLLADGTPIAIVDPGGAADRAVRIGTETVPFPGVLDAFVAGDQVLGIGYTRGATVRVLHPTSARAELDGLFLAWRARTTLAADDGTVAGGSQGVVVRSARGAERFLDHAGRTRSLAFSPDGKFVAASTAEATTVARVEDGTVIEVLAEPTWPAPGPAGPEFWFAGARGVRRWNAAVRRDVGLETPWPEDGSITVPRPRVSASPAGSPLFGDRWLLGVDNERVVLAGSGRRPYSGPVVLHADGLIEPIYGEIEPAPAGTMLAHAFAIDCTDDRIYVVQDEVRGSSMAAARDFHGAIRVCRRDGARVAERFTRAQPTALAASTSHGVFVAWADRRLARLDGGTLESEREVELASAARWLAMEGDELLAIGGDQLWVFEPQTLAVKRWHPLPTASIGAVAVAPGGKRLAIAAGTSVWILQRP